MSLHALMCHGLYIDMTTETQGVPDLQLLSLTKNQINEHRESDGRQSNQTRSMLLCYGAYLHT